MNKKDLIFDYSIKNKSAYSLPPDFLPQINLNSIEKTNLLRTKRPKLPEVSEIDIVRHYTAISKMNYGVDDGLYPLGSCTMKYNPKVNEDMAALENFLLLHRKPYLSKGSIYQNMFCLGQRLLLKIIWILKVNISYCNGIRDNNTCH